MKLQCIITVAETVQMLNRKKKI